MQSQKDEWKAAVFYDVDGTLVKTNILHVYLFYAMTMPDLRHRARRLASLLLRLPLLYVSEKRDRGLFNKKFYKIYEGLPEERIRLLGEELTRQVLLPSLFIEASKRIQAAKSAGLIQVAVTGSIDSAISPFIESVGIDHYISNQLIYDRGTATGYLKEPVLSGDGKRQVIEEFAREHSIDLSRSYAFGDAKADIPMLESVGFPVAVNADSYLRKHAEQKGWKIEHFYR